MDKLIFRHQEISTFALLKIPPESNRQHFAYQANALPVELKILLLGYEADLRTPVPFGYSPSIATLLVLLSTSLDRIRPVFRFQTIRDR